MNDSWIVPGAKAIIVKTTNYNQLKGEIVTIKKYPHFVAEKKTVKLEEGEEFARMVGIKQGRLNTMPEHIKPYNGNNYNYSKLSSWDDFEKQLGFNLSEELEEV